MFNFIFKKNNKKVKEHLNCVGCDNKNGKMCIGCPVYIKYLESQRKNNYTEDGWK